MDVRCGHAATWMMWMLSDVDTRRRAACDFVRVLCKSFEAAVIGNFSVYVQNMLQVTAPLEPGRYHHLLILYDTIIC